LAIAIVNFFVAKKSFRRIICNRNVSWRYGLVNSFQKSTCAICWKSMDEVLMFAFVSKIVLSFQNVVFTRDDP
jgi:hypothetical protein